MALNISHFSSPPGEDALGEAGLRTVSLSGGGDGLPHPWFRKLGPTGARRKPLGHRLLTLCCGSAGQGAEQERGRARPFWPFPMWAALFTDFFLPLSSLSLPERFRHFVTVILTFTLLPGASPSFVRLHSLACGMPSVRRDSTMNGKPLNIRCIYKIESFLFLTSVT